MEVPNAKNADFKAKVRTNNAPHHATLVFIEPLRGPAGRFRRSSQAARGRKAVGFVDEVRREQFFRRLRRRLPRAGPGAGTAAGLGGLARVWEERAEPSRGAGRPKGAAACLSSPSHSLSPEEPAGSELFKGMYREFVIGFLLIC